MQNLIAGIRQIGAKSSLNKAMNQQTKSVSELNISDNDIKKRQNNSALGYDGHNTQKNKIDQIGSGMILGSGGIQPSGNLRGLQMNIKSEQ